MLESSFYHIRQDLIWYSALDELGIENCPIIKGLINEQVIRSVRHSNKILQAVDKKVLGIDNNNFVFIICTIDETIIFISNYSLHIFIG